MQTRLTERWLDVCMYVSRIESYDSADQFQITHVTTSHIPENAMLTHAMMRDETQVSMFECVQSWPHLQICMLLTWFASACTDRQRRIKCKSTAAYHPIVFKAEGNLQANGLFGVRTKHFVSLALCWSCCMLPQITLDEMCWNAEWSFTIGGCNQRLS